jgi:hypothetical protein
MTVKGTRSGLPPFWVSGRPRRILLRDAHISIFHWPNTSCKNHVRVGGSGTWRRTSREDRGANIEQIAGKSNALTSDDWPVHAGEWHWRRF